MNKNYRKWLLILGALCILTGAYFIFSQPKGKPDQPVTIIYTNDTHTYINNSKDDVEGLSFASVAALKDDLKAEGKSVILVDCGDAIQGTAFGAIDKGETIIEIMNATGYSLSTFGNHEFDYGTERALKLPEEAEFTYISCDFYDTATGKSILDATKIIEIDGVKVGFVGITTPETLTSSAPAYFMDEAQENYLYYFYGLDNPQDLYDSVQKAIDSIKNKCDYIVAVGHCGVDESSEPFRSVDIIKNVSGLDAFIDGHSHTTIEMDIVNDKDNNAVVLSQTGSYFGAIGELTLTKDGVNTALITEYNRKDETVNAMEKKWVSTIDEILGETIATTDINFMTVDEQGNRIIRSEEANIGDLNADAYYAYFNEVMGIDTDVAICNGGGIRANMVAGDISYQTLKDINPFGNVLCIVEVDGQTLLDMLEWSTQLIGVMSEETGRVAENGNFQHVAGIRYTVDTAKTSGVVATADGLYDSNPTNEYRVCDVEVYNKKTASYEALDLNKIYRICGNNYTLTNLGGGNTMLKTAEVVVDYSIEDYLAFSAYLSMFDTDGKELPVINSENSPLASYKNYQLNYEDPHGAGRVTIK